jgi:ABC-type multidrug transport system ATPase subunit
MVNKPDLLILDEPTNGLDPQGIAEIRNLIRSLSKDHGKTILISSHLLHEMELIASSMLVLHRGKKIADGKVNDLLNPAQKLVEFAIQDTTIIMDQLLHSAWASSLDHHAADALVFKLHPDRIPLLNAWIVEQGGHVKGIRSKHSLEDYFLSITHD